MNRLILLLALCLPLAAQVNFYTTSGDVSLTAAGTKVTVQQTASAGNKTAKLSRIVVYCSVDCVVTQEQNGTAATATAATPIKLNPYSIGATLTAFTASNVGSGSASGPSIHIPAGNTLTYDASAITLPRGGTNVNYTVVVGTITGTANISIFWSEPE